MKFLIVFAGIAVTGLTKDSVDSQNLSTLDSIKRRAGDLYREVDSNKDGKVSLQQLSEGVKKGLGLAEDEGKSYTQLLYQKFVGGNKKNYFTQEDFQEIFSTRKSRGHQNDETTIQYIRKKASELYKSFDKNKDGNVNLQQVTEGLKEGLGFGSDEEDDQKDQASFITKAQNLYQKYVKSDKKDQKWFTQEDFQDIIQKTTKKSNSKCKKNKNCDDQQSIVSKLKGKAEQAYSKFDQNKDGHVSFQQLKEGLKQGLNFGQEGQKDSKDKNSLINYANQLYQKYVKSDKKDNKSFSKQDFFDIFEQKRKQTYLQKAKAKANQLHKSFDTDKDGQISLEQVTKGIKAGLGFGQDSQDDDNTLSNKVNQLYEKYVKSDKKNNKGFTIQDITDIVQQNMKKAKKTISRKASDVKQSAQQIIDSASEKGQQIKQKVSKTASGAKKKASQKAEKIRDNIVQSAQQLKDNVAQSAGNIKDKLSKKASQAADVISDKASDIKQSVKDTLSKKASQAADVISDKASDLKDTLSEKASQAAGVISDKASDLKDTLSEKASDIKQSVKDTLSEKASQAADAISDKASDLKDTLSEKASQAAGVISDKASDIKQSVKDTLSEKASQAADVISDKASDLKDTLSKKASQAADVISDKASDIKQSVKDTLSEKASQAADVISDKSSDIKQSVESTLSNAWKSGQQNIQQLKKKASQIYKSFDKNKDSHVSFDELTAGVKSGLWLDEDRGEQQKDQTNIKNYLSGLYQKYVKADQKDKSWFTQQDFVKILKSRKTQKSLKKGGFNLQQLKNMALDIHKKFDSDKDGHVNLNQAAQGIKNKLGFKSQDEKDQFSLFNYVKSLYHRLVRSGKNELKLSKDDFADIIYEWRQQCPARQHDRDQQQL